MSPCHRVQCHYEGCEVCYRTRKTAQMNWHTPQARAASAMTASRGSTPAAAQGQVASGLRRDEGSPRFRDGRAEESVVMAGVVVRGVMGRVRRRCRACKMFPAQTLTRRWRRLRGVFFWWARGARVGLVGIVIGNGCHGQ